MRVKDVSCAAMGMVSPSFIDIRTGKRVPFDMRHNTLSYMSAEAMAAAFGGDPSYIPSRIGYIYGDKSEFPTGDESSEKEISRYQDWDSLCNELRSASQSATIDVQVVGFSYSPTLGGEGVVPAGSSSSPDSSSDPCEGGDYGHILPTGSNAITFHAVSNSQDAGAVFSTEAFKTGNYIYQCLLLGYHNGQYYILARASLKDGERYLSKPDGFEISLDWTVAFR